MITAKMLLTGFACALMVALMPVGAFAAPGGASHPVGPPAGAGHPTGPPTGAGHPAGPPPGRPSNPGNTDRGQSEGQGHNDQHPSHFVARVASISGTMLTVRTPDGKVRTFTVSASALGQLRPTPGTNLVLFTNGGVLLQRAIPADVTFTGELTKVNKDQVTFRLPNGQLRTITVSKAAVAHMMPGRRLLVESHDGGFTAATIRPPIR